MSEDTTTATAYNPRHALRLLNRISGAQKWRYVGHGTNEPTFVSDRLVKPRTASEEDTAMKVEAFLQNSGFDPDKYKQVFGATATEFRIPAGDIEAKWNDLVSLQHAASESAHR